MDLGLLHSQTTRRNSPASPPAPIDIFGRTLPADPPGCESPAPTNTFNKRRSTKTSESNGSGKSRLSRHSTSGSAFSNTASATTAPPSSRHSSSPSKKRFQAENVPLPTPPPLAHPINTDERPSPRVRTHSMTSQLSDSSGSSASHVDIARVSRARVQPMRQASGDLVQLSIDTTRSSQYQPDNRAARASQLAQVAADFPAIPSPASISSSDHHPSPSSGTDVFPPSVRQSPLPPNPPSMPGFLSLFVEHTSRPPSFDVNLPNVLPVGMEPEMRHHSLRHRSRQSSQIDDNIPNSATASLKDLARAAEQLKRRLDVEAGSAITANTHSQKVRTPQKKPRGGRWWLNGTRIRDPGAHAANDSLSEHWSAFRSHQGQPGGQNSKPGSKWGDSFGSIVRSKWARMALVLILALVGAVIAVSVILSRRRQDIPTTGDPLDSHCVRTNSTPIARGFFDLAQDANKLFQPAINLDRLPLVLSRYLGIEGERRGSCRSQLRVLDIASLPEATYPNRRAWTQAATLWTEAISESSTSLFRFASNLNFGLYGDEPSSMPNSNYQIISAGFTFDFAQMTMFPPTISWASEAEPSLSQLRFISDELQTTLDRLTAFAVASNRARMTPLKHLWSELGLRASDLDSFRTAWRQASVNFGAAGSISSNATAAQISQQLVRPSCTPIYDAAQIEAVNAIEHAIFGLQAVTDVSLGNTTACLVRVSSTPELWAPADRLLQDRPLYGTLQFFNSSSTALTRPAVVLTEEAKSRCTLRVGATLLNLLDGNTETVAQDVKITDFGLFSSIDSVMFDFLVGLEPSLARNIVEAMLRGSGLDTSELPVVEVQLWGGLPPEAFVSSISAVLLP